MATRTREAEQNVEQNTQPVGKAKLPPPTLDEMEEVESIPSGGGNAGAWGPIVPVIKENPGKTFLFRTKGSSQVGTLRRTHGLDAVGRNTRYINPETGEVVPEGKGVQVVDIYVTYRPELEAALKAGTEKGRRGRPAANPAPSQANGEGSPEG